MYTEYVPFHEMETSLDTSLSVNGRIFILPNDFSGRVVSNIYFLYIVMIYY